MPAGLDPTGGILSTATAALGAVEGGIELFDNLKNEGKDRKALNNLSNPFYTIQNEYYQNRNLAGNEAETGIPSATKDYVTGETQRGLGAAISGINQAGGNPNDINKAFSIFNKSIDATGAQDAEQHMKNIQYYMKTNSDLAGQKNIQWGLNKKQPYEEKLKQLSENISADKTNAAGGASTAIGSLGALGTSMSNNTLLNSLFAGGSPDAPSSNVGTGTVSNIDTGNSNSAPSLNTTPTSIDPNTPNLVANYQNPFH